MTELAKRVEAAGGGSSSANLFNAVGELALAIRPHYMDADQRKRIATAIGALVDNILEVAALRARKD